MNFRDELNEICRTPEEVAAEKSSKEYKEGEKSASLTHNYIKDEIRKRVKSGEYEIVDGRKCVKFYYDKNNLLLFDSRPKKSEYRINKSFFNRMGDYRAKTYYEIYDMDYYNGFMKTFNELNEKDNIHAEIIGLYDCKNLGRKLEFDPVEGAVLGQPASLDRFSVVVKCEITF